MSENQLCFTNEYDETVRHPDELPEYLTLQEAIINAPNKELLTAVASWAVYQYPKVADGGSNHQWRLRFSKNNMHIIEAYVREKDGKIVYNEGWAIYDGRTKMWQPDVMWDDVSRETLDECDLRY